MPSNKRQMCLSDIKNSFNESGIVDWHISPRLAHEHNEDSDSDLAVQHAPRKLKRPPLYAFVLINEDYTPMAFVIEIFQQYIAINLDQASQVMLCVHYEGKGVAG